jgi:hypothetical protein
LSDFDKELNKINLKFKGLNDQLKEEIEKVRREFNIKFDKKLDVTEALNIVNEINIIKE